MSTVQVSGKTLTAVQVTSSFAQYYSDQSKNYAEQAKQYRDEAKKYAETASNLVNGFNDTTEEAKQDILEVATLAETEITEFKTEAVAELETKANELMTSVNDLLTAVNSELEEIIGE